ncbi:hypothetical protein JOD64_001328 [Micromonospora luteifusca]|uniref:Uncharacterized protein n=1 Tax=Micromonospora luteifusca TaxID=709860 RepID=A0ABS2LPJ4_9ACTN|nr:hypothetical protein [Micromonospora luteifusca]MBM7490106.1 hypothetical protein [Micromonospora luteifusca]
MREGVTDGVTTWRAPGRTLRVVSGSPWRCADGADIIASLDADLPPNPTAKIGESGRDGIGHRAAWLYRHDGDVRFSLYGYTFVDTTYLETVFSSADTADLGWALDAWRSVTVRRQRSGQVAAGSRAPR